MADGLGEQAEVGSLAGARYSAVVRSAQGLEVLDRPLDVRPEPADEVAVGGEAENLGDREEQLAGAVVLRHRVGAPAVDAAGHLPRGVLEAGEPFDEGPRLFGVAEPKESRRGEGAVANPRSGVGPRPRPQGRSARLIST